MGLKGKVTSLDDVAEQYRSLYEQDGDVFILTEYEPEDTSGLKSALDKEKKARREAKEALDKLKDVDPEEYTRLKHEATERENSKLTAEGRFDELKKKWDLETQKKIDALTGELTDVRTKLRKRTLDDVVRAAAIKAGVLADDLDDVLTITARRFTLDEKERPVVLDQDGELMDMSVEKFFADDFKSSRPKFYAASGVGGSGAPSNTGGGSAKGTKTIKRSEFEAMDQAGRMAVAKSGTKIEDP